MIGEQFRVIAGLAISVAEGSWFPGFLFFSILCAPDPATGLPGQGGGVCRKDGPMASYDFPLAFRRGGDTKVSGVRSGSGIE